MTSSQSAENGKKSVKTSINLNVSAEKRHF